LFRFKLTLDQRIEFLSLAVGNAKSHPMSQTDREANALSFLTDLEEKLEVAQVQAEILHTLEAEFTDRDAYVQQKINELGASFKTVTEVGFRRMRCDLADIFIALGRLCGATKHARCEASSSSHF
jgi:hypothetical protein